MNPGIIDLPMSEYIALPAFSASTAHAIDARSPLHAWTDSPMNPNRDRSESKEADLGTFAHACLLEGGYGALEIVDGENWTKKCIHNGIEAAAHVHRKDIRARGKLPILRHQIAEVDAMCNEARRFISTTELAGLFDSGKPEQTLVWERDDIRCKARPDWLNTDKRILLHFKTCSNAEPGGWQRRQLSGQGYDLAAVHYDSGIETITGEKYRSVFLVQEVEPPFSCQLTALSPALRDVTFARWIRAFRIYQKCLQSGKWPAYSAEIHYAEPAAWQIGDVEERDMREAYDALQEKEGLQP